MRFIVIDALVVVPYFCFVYYLAQHHDEGSKWILLFKDVGVNLLISVIIACSAIQITNFVKTKTKQKPNSCLLFWHIFNLFLQISATILRIV